MKNSLTCLFAFSICLFFNCDSNGTNKMHSSDPSNWSIDKKYVFKSSGGPATKSIEQLLHNLKSINDNGPGISKEEFENLLDRNNSKEVYAEQLIKYATPKSKKIQKQEHQNYLNVFMKERRLRDGVKFLKNYKSLLTEAENKYGVAKQDIVSILMWESGLGEFTGEYRIFNIFMAQLLFLEAAQEYSIQQILANGEPNPLLDITFANREQKRFEKIKERAIKSLTALLQQCKAKGIDPLEQKGSWGGAIGYVQFMPYRMNFAVDGDGDGNINLHSWPDAIFSVANYLKEFGNYGKSYKMRRQGIYSYNHSNSYVDGVIKYADTIWNRYQYN